ncbi:substrate-binding domain-containing protein [Paenibacillus sp. sptzw28]|uniref:sugar ABC transporter substrate-binding protein n=1 Tax=Paenibacillus sp. sptzw28 TaxID=715179 RepID=UPI001C6E70AE|nr:substrate-binding domain-containing protein [Paenibacillus sp. sptzw28]QYR21084.1 substrate-binding domain-containing protein [Paenibacillus sp. sptzw28]
MRKLLILLLPIVCLILFYFTITSLVKVFRADAAIPPEPEAESSEYRLVLITQELNTPFWNKVEAGAMAAARRSGAVLEVWGSYGMNQEEFLKKMEIAIASKVNGIIAQGLDTDDFNRLISVKAAENGIPVITVANDAPGSLRRTYVGSDHYKAGQMIGRQLLADMGDAGTVVLLKSDRQEDYQSQREKGILNVLDVKAHPNLRIVTAATDSTRDKVIRMMNDVLNLHPNADAFISLTAGNTSAMVQAIDNRSQAEKDFIYSFDDSPETRELLRRHKIDALIQQSPEKVGELSVNLMVQWLKGQTVPLNYRGYFTNMRILKAENIG